MDYFKTNLDQLHEQLRSGKLTSRQLVDETLAGIDKIDPEVAAFLAINADGAKKQAAAIDEADNAVESSRLANRTTRVTTQSGNHFTGRHSRC